jgi:hypothetical protein
MLRRYDMSRGSIPAEGALLKFGIDYRQQKLTRQAENSTEYYQIRIQSIHQ